MAEKKEKQYVSDNAQLMAEWDWERNIELGMDPQNLTCGSHKKVWWKCDKGHEWQAVIGSRNNGCGCPYCSGCLPIKGQNDLQAINPILAKEWNYDKNYGLTPLDVLPIEMGRLLGRVRRRIKKPQLKNRKRRLIMRMPLPIPILSLWWQGSRVENSRITSLFI